MDNLQLQDTSEFMWRRLSEECPPWAVGVPVLFAFLVVALIVIFRQERKLMSAIVGVVVVGIIALVYLPLSLLLIKILSWMVILIPVMAVALFYVVLMYIRDAKTVHWLWAIFLGLLRTCVYVILGVVFLLPGCQHSDKQEYESKVVFLFDVSASMEERDDRPEEGQKPETLPTRQDKVLKFLTHSAEEKGEKALIDRVVQKSRVDAYRFGEILDENDIVNLHPKKQESVTFEEWKRFLKPNKDDIKKPNEQGLKEEELKKKYAQFEARLKMVDDLRSGTNIGGAALQVHKIENSSYIQAFIIFSDGQSNKGSSDALTDFLSRANNPKRPIPVITVGVGLNRLPVSIRIDDINAPEETRPDDKFPIRVPVVSTGLPGEPFTVTVEVTRVKDVTGKPIEKNGQTTYPLPPKKGIFKKGTGDQHQGVVEFEVDLQELAGVQSKDDKDSVLEGEWRIVAKVPRHKEENFTDPLHVSDPVHVQVQKRKLRVLLFAGGATREYVFLRGILAREMKEGRMEFCVCNQSTGKEDHVDEDVEPERMLTDFPNTLGLNKGGERFMSLSDYDVIVAFDPDWTRLSVNQRKLLNKWVGENAGGIIFVAGPIYSYQLARWAKEDFSAIVSLYPVVPKDSRLHGTGLPGTSLGHDPTRPYALNFTPAAKQYDFLKLDEDAKSPIAGWNGFFWNDEQFNPEPGKDFRPKRGFFTYYPVERLKAASEVVATFAGPKESRIGEKSLAFKDQQPFIVALTYGSGKSLYVSSGEFWRLRAYKDGFHQRLWIKMARYVAAGAKAQKKYGRILMARSVPIGKIDFEAQIKGKDLLPLSSKERPTVLVRRISKKSDGAPDPKDQDKKDAPKEKQDVKADNKADNLKFDLQPKPTEGDWQGYFYGSLHITEPGEWEFRLPILTIDDKTGQEKYEYLKQNVIVRKPNPEKDNVRTNFGYLYQLASPSDTLLRSLPADTRKKIEAKMQVPDGQTSAGNGKTSKRLFFELATADAISDCLVPVPPKSDTIKGRFEDLWDQSISPEWSDWVYWPLVLAPIGIAALVAIILLILGQWQAALGSLFIGAFFSSLPVLICYASGESVEIFWAVLLAPIIVGAIGAIILLLLRQWIGAIAFFGICVVISLLALLFCYFPIFALVLAGAAFGLGALIYAIVLAIKKEIFGIVVIALACLCLAGLGVYLGWILRDGFIEDLATSIKTESLPVGFSVLLIVAVSLVGLEWLTRKLLRLA
jgi:hypothetical protein